MELSKSINLPGYVAVIVNRNAGTDIKPSFPQALVKDKGLVRLLRIAKEAEMIGSGQLVMPPLDTLQTLISSHSEGVAPDIDAELSARDRKLRAIIADMKEEPKPWSTINNSSAS